MTRQYIVADDHPLFREALKGAVARHDTGIRFVDADSVAGLLAAIEAEPDADLLLLDLNMPGAQGFNALAHVRGARPALPVIVVSADDGHLLWELPLVDADQLIGEDPLRRVGGITPRHCRAPHCDAVARRAAAAR